jgi:hypothetical protein
MSQHHRRANNRVQEVTDYAPYGNAVWQHQQITTTWRGIRRSENSARCDQADCCVLGRSKTTVGVMLRRMHPITLAEVEKIRAAAPVPAPNPAKTRSRGSGKVN